jgi:hypothetical protein
MPEHVARVGEKGRDHVEELGVEEKIILQWILGYTGFMWVSPAVFLRVKLGLLP